MEASSSSFELVASEPTLKCPVSGSLPPKFETISSSSSASTSFFWAFASFTLLVDGLLVANIVPFLPLVCGAFFWTTEHPYFDDPSILAKNSSVNVGSLGKLIINASGSSFLFLVNSKNVLFYICWYSADFITLDKRSSIMANSAKMFPRLEVEGRSFFDSSLNVAFGPGMTLASSVIFVEIITSGLSLFSS